jgi:UDP-N-acetylglucosamine acyltransferase
LVAEGARLGPGTEIGPFAVIGPRVCLGARCRVLAHAQIVNDVRLGDDCVVGRGCVLGEDPQSLSFDPDTPSGLEAGAGNVFRELVTVHRSARAGGATRIGEANYFMAASHVGHDAVIGDRNVVANACLLAGHVEVGNRAFLGGGAGFHQFVRIGDLAMVQGNAVMNRDVPPFLMAGASSRLFGLNVVGLRRAGIEPAQRDELRRLYRLLFRGERNLSQALEASEAMEWGDAAGRLLSFLRQPSKQGVCRATGRE